MPAVMKKINNISRCQARYRQPLIPEGFNQRQNALILLLSRSFPLTQEQIAAELCLDKSSASRLLCSFEEQGYIKRVQNPRDKRELHIHPEQKLLDAALRVREVTRRWNELLCENISPDEVEIFYAVLSKMESRAKEIVESGVV
jgi:DNA-binding MarR family transcriptional regulator